jgi:hypothetical protein
VIFASHLLLHFSPLKSEPFFSAIQPQKKLFLIFNEKVKGGMELL